MGASRVFIPRMLLGAPMMGQCVMAGCKESQFYGLLFRQLSPKKFLMSSIYYSSSIILIPAKNFHLSSGQVKNRVH